MPYRNSETLWRIIVGSFLFLLFGFCELATGQVVKEEVRLFDRPSGVPQGASVPSGTVTKVVERQGFWVRVDINGRTGWIKASGLSFSSVSAGPTAIDTGRLGTGNIVSTSAARGLSAKDLVSGQPNTEELAWLESRSISPDIQAFLASGGVVAILGRIQLAAPRTAAAATAGQGYSGDIKNAPKKKNDDDW